MGFDLSVAGVGGSVVREFTGAPSPSPLGPPTAPSGDAGSGSSGNSGGGEQLLTSPAVLGAGAGMLLLLLAGLGVTCARRSSSARPKAAGAGAASGSAVELTPRGCAALPECATRGAHPL